MFVEEGFYMEVKRINSYNDDRFTKKVLNQHGAFLVDGTYPCEFEIINEDTAIIKYHDLNNIDIIINEFRFYAEHITKFLDIEGNLIKAFHPIKKIWIEISEIQPSQFYIDSDKVNAINEFINKESDIVIPLIKCDNRYISLDGHTRLYIANKRGFRRVLGFLTTTDNYIYKFVEEAINRGIIQVSNLLLVDHRDYEILWHKFCDDFFSKLDNKES